MLSLKKPHGLNSTFEVVVFAVFLESTWKHNLLSHDRFAFNFESSASTLNRSHRIAMMQLLSKHWNPVLLQLRYKLMMRNDSCYEESV